MYVDIIFTYERDGDEWPDSVGSRKTIEEL